MDRHQYVDLLVSLPHLRNPFVSEQTPILSLRNTVRLQQISVVPLLLTLPIRNTFFYAAELI